MDCGHSRFRLSHWPRAGLALLLHAYLAPTRWHPRLRLWAKDAGMLWPSEHLFRALGILKRRPLWRRAALVVDVGAADGSVAAWFANALPNATVYCYEPNTHAWPGLESRFSGTRVQVRRLALGDVPAQEQFHATKNRVSSSLLRLDPQRLADHPLRQALREVAAFDVTVSTLDQELETTTLPIALLKLDAQGTELRILEGGERVLERTDVVLSEMANHRLYETGCQYHEVDAHLRNRGFRLADLIVTYRGTNGVDEYDAVYVKERPIDR